ncbi:MAG: carboxysome shell carbonic anhydrase [Thiobacillus sp.]|nr:carboxysome shell carbonic anhydrase [Thiobacillus sp.]
MGIIQPFRNLGGRFDLGWPHLGEMLSDYVMSVVREGRRVLLTSTYHFSKGDPHHGCAGFNYDTEAARAHSFAIRSQIEQVYGADHQTVYPLVCGFETNDDALILHGQNGDVLDASTVTDIETLPVRLQTLFPDMPEQMRDDLLPLVLGNIRYVAEVRQAARALDIEHREWMICLGRGFDWLHMPNQALIIGPYSPDLDDPVRKAAGILQSNMVAGRILDDGILLLVSVPYAEIGVDRARRTQVALPLRLRSRSHHARVSTTGRKNAPQNGRVELGQPKSGIAGERLRGW